MNPSKSFLLQDKFSHIYIEEAALKHPVTQSILGRFPHAKTIEIGHYKDLFNRSNQNFQVQKSSQKLILALKKDNFIYEGADVCHSFGHSHFYYTSSVLNCIYNCDYCYLQGMFPSSNIVVFVNIEDFILEAKSLLKRYPVYLTVSYDTDLLAFEGIYPFSAKWIEFASRSSDLTIELRTKSVNYKAISHIKPCSNVILAFTISPDEIINLYEKGTPSLASRLDAIKRAVSDGWKVRLCFDPLLLSDGWQNAYKDCIEKTFRVLTGTEINDVSIGVFRMASDYLKKIRKGRHDSSLIHYPFECRNGVYSYPDELKNDMIGFVYSEIAKYIEEGKIFII